MATMLKGAKGWNHGWSDSEFYKHFGPITVRVSRVWNAGSPKPTHYEAAFAFGNADMMVRETVAIEALGCDWFDDAADARACKLLEKKIKATIRGWAK